MLILNFVEYPTLRKNNQEYDAVQIIIRIKLKFILTLKCSENMK